ncbi:MAG TPA: V-type ATP synthase subunit D [Thermodesulfovibrionales bacterium]|nr:V-type ATP synthase subunit D [Thermodesulfovibrionales bacterium]
MIHPTRTNLLLLKEKARSVANSTGILKARKQALIKEFLDTTRPFLRSREDIRNSYGNALQELALSLGHEGKETIESITVATERDFRIDITEKSIWGLKYKDVIVHEVPVREPDKRGYDRLSTTVHLDEAFDLFEKLLEAMIENAEFESKIKRLGEEILRTTRKIRVLEELVFPELKHQIKTITQFIAERERESHFRLKKFKEIRSREAASL